MNLFDRIIVLAEFVAAADLPGQIFLKQFFSAEHRAHGLCDQIVRDSSSQTIHRQKCLLHGGVRFPGIDGCLLHHKTAAFARHLPVKYIGIARCKLAFDVWHPKPHQFKFRLIRADGRHRDRHASRASHNGCLSHPAEYRRRLAVRDLRHLFCYRELHIRPRIMKQQIPHRFDI